jgi:hypothetical protein
MVTRTAAIWPPPDPAETRRLIQAASYTNAATVEFIVDKNGNFYFIEVNFFFEIFSSSSISMLYLVVLV